MQRLWLHWTRANASYWFIPSLTSLGAVLLFLLTYYLDRVTHARWVERWMLWTDPDGARYLLTTVAAALMTVGGVAFSVTIGAVAYAASQFGPRLLTSFMHDRGAQLSLGTFIATFLYSILVLLTIRGGPDGGAFVPQLGITFDLVLVLVSLGMLIYFFHHVLDTMSSFNVLAQIGEQFNDMIAELYPERTGYEAADDPVHSDEVLLPEGFQENVRLVRSTADGYIQAVDDETLFAFACEQDLIVRLVHRPGDFVNKDRVVLLAWPAQRVSDELAQRMANTFLVGTQRTPYQDAMFLIKELIEFAARALSPAVNDPYTAISCINWLGSNLVTLARRAAPSACRYDLNGKLRLVAEPLVFDQLADTIFDSLRPYVTKDPNVTLHMMDMIRWVAPQLPGRRQRRILLGHATALKTSSDKIADNDRNHIMIGDLYKDAVEKLVRIDEPFAEAQPESISRAAGQQG